MSHSGGVPLGALHVTLGLATAAVFWLCGIVHLQRLVFGRTEIRDVDGPVDGAHLAMAAYMAFMFVPGYSGRTERLAAAAFLAMAAGLVARATRRRLVGRSVLPSAMTAVGGAAMAYMLVGDSGRAVAMAIALLLAACVAAHLRTLAGMLHRSGHGGSQSPLVGGGQAASAVMTTGMVFMLLQM
jgi:Domain of unknown function (DUF5134)